jgi:glutamine amidotransferase
MLPGTVGVVDYGMGNLLSVLNGFEMVGANVSLCRGPDELRDVDRIVLPGVGAFGACVRSLKARGYWEALSEEVTRKMKPFLGICLGMQVTARKSTEGGITDGLGWFDAEVVRLTPSDPKLRVPQIGWNDVSHEQRGPMHVLSPGTEMYFVHSYSMRCADQTEVAATCDYGGPVTAAVLRDNIFAVQFHPEKSQCPGLRLLESFAKWRP